MVERPEEQRLSSPIVPDVSASLTASHLRYPRPKRLWPLWLAILLLLLALAGLGVVAWQEQQRLVQQFERLQGQLSNVHARFDGFGEEQDELEPITEHLTALDGNQQTLRERLEEQEQLIESIRVSSADDTVVSELTTRHAELAEEFTALDGLLGIMQQSLDALEEGGEQARAALAGRMQQLEQRVDGIPDVDPQRFDELSDELNHLETALERLNALRDDDQQTLAELYDSLSSTRAELTELRQSQLAANAQLEALQSQPGN